MVMMIQSTQCIRQFVSNKSNPQREEAVDHLKSKEEKEKRKRRERRMLLLLFRPFQFSTVFLFFFKNFLIFSLIFLF